MDICAQIIKLPHIFPGNLVRKCYDSQATSPMRTEKTHHASNFDILSRYSTLRDSESQLNRDQLSKFSVPTRASKANRIRDTHGVNAEQSDLPSSAYELSSCKDIALFLLLSSVVL